MSQPNPAEKSRLIKLTKQSLHYLHRKRTSLYLKQTDLDHLKVKWVGIDVDNGTPDASQKFWDLYPLDQMKAIAEKQNLDEDNVLILSNEPSFAWYCAANLGRVYNAWLDTLEYPPELEVVPKSWPWIKSPCGKYHFVGQIAVQWRLIFCLRSCGLSQPNITGYLANLAPFKPGQPLISELICVLGKSISVWEHDKDGKHSIVPVTIVSVSGRLGRIVQGYVNPSTGEVIMRISETVRMGNDKEKNKEVILKFGCWLFGSPSEETTS
ncbi:hypothetical protein F5B19DRAFT_478986 [Rostrohypoxylon terebratum]|nr:hypothetical protein F5B19DRAFT_478986 [Rostrohypoxylon terebratum]